MIDQETRQAVLKLKKLEYGTRRIARTLKISRWAVRQILATGTDEVPDIERDTTAAKHRDQIVREIALCKGNLTRVHEELVNDGIELSYPALTYFVRKHGLAKAPKLPVGRYPAEPGVEAQHDTSPHDVTFEVGKRRCQCASIILAYSRMLYFQYAKRFTRFDCKVFLTEALRYFDAVPKHVLVDNTNVVVLYGTGAEAVICPEMKSFADRFDFDFIAHELGDANRSGKIERPFRYIEGNFLVKRTFKDFEDLNRQAAEFCDRNNAGFKRKLRARPVELFAAEKTALKELPPYIPEVYELFQRTVDLEGYVNLHTNTYSAPYQLIGQRVEVRETRSQVKVFHKHREVAGHDRMQPGSRSASTQKQHRPPRGAGRRKKQPVPEELRLREQSEALDAYINCLKKRCVGRGATPIRRLYRMMKEYPADSFDKAIETALRYGMTDLDRLESMILSNIAGDYFQLPIGNLSQEEDDDE